MSLKSEKETILCWGDRILDKVDMNKTKDVLPDLFEPPDLLVDRYVSDVCKQTQCTINTFPAPARLPSPRYAASEFLKFLFHVCWVVQPRRGPGGTAALSPSLGAEF